MLFKSHVTNPVSAMDEAGNKKTTNKREPKKSAPGSKNRESLGDDYWERVADDVAKGYKSDEDENNILNIDQEPGDQNPGDKDPGS